MIITEQNQIRRTAEARDPALRQVRPRPSAESNNSEIRQPRRESGENHSQPVGGVKSGVAAAPQKRTKQIHREGTAQQSAAQVRRPDNSQQNVRAQNPPQRPNNIQNQSEARSAVQAQQRAVTPDVARRPASRSANVANLQPAPQRAVSQRSDEVRKARPSADEAAQRSTGVQKSSPQAAASQSMERRAVTPKQVGGSHEAGVVPTVRPSKPATSQNASAHFQARSAQSENAAVQNRISSASAKRNQSLMEARTMDISTVRGKFKSENKVEDKTEKKKRKEKEDSGSGEGGNTVISIVKAVVYITFVFVVSIFISYFTIVIGNDVFAFVKSDEAVEVVIPEYATLDDVANILYENDVIKYPKIFKLYADLENFNGEFVAGTYTVTPMMNYDSLLEAFKEKPVRGTIELTIPEGYTTDEIIDLFVSNGIGTREGFIDVIQNYDFDYWFIDELEANGISEDRIYRLDGYLFPDTYQFYLESSEATVINKLLKRFSQIFKKDEREACAYLGYTVDEIITLASIIEKEAGSSAEFFKVSSVFHNRLNNPWNYPKLESDATIVYAIQHDTGERIVIKDTNYETPYNTYKYDGLPPGPISNPSASAMLAALQPQETNYYFFIANNGTTYFSETKAQHDAYIEQFRNEAQND